MIPVLVVLIAATIVAAAVISIKRQRQNSAVEAKLVGAGRALPTLGSRMSWLAVRTTDRDELISMLQLRNVKTVSWAEGIGTIYAENGPDSCAFITPPAGEWTLVAGLALPHPLGPAFKDKCTPLLESLSARFGAAQYYFAFPLLDYYAWAKAEDGAITRAFATGDEGIIWNRGRLTPEERQLKLRLFELRGVQDRRGDVGGDMMLVPTEAQVLKLAQAWSCDPRVLEQADEIVKQGGLVGLAPVSWRSERLHRRVAA